ncbi:MAG: helix-hairpin-helix domain-containing protein, partial [Thermoproteales archaeon]|nr:helix-hairpin-helix domain-containing protein [Thermoproteales archaeon]
IPMRLSLYEKLDVLVVDHGPRSVTGIPFPLNVNKAPASALAMVPGLGRAAVTRILAHRPFRSIDKLKEIVDTDDVIKYLTTK